MKTKKILLTAVAILLLFTCTQSVKAQTFNTLWASQFQTALNTAVSTNNIKGASVAIYSPGQGLWTGVSGNSSLGVPITADMSFGIASNTKLFIATVILKLQEQNVLSLNDHLYQWLPSFPNIDSTATIRQLLSHQTGFFDYLNDNCCLWTDSIWADSSRFWTSQELLAIIGAPHFAPGMGCQYSNTNYLLAAMIIESATGNTWVQNLHTFIFDPLNMDSTFVGTFEAPNGTVAHMWDATWGEISNSPMTSLFTTGTAAGGILSTSSEMVQWYSALFSGQIIADSSLKEILNFQPIQCGYVGFNYGLGLMESYYSDPTIDYAYYHSGSMLGYQSIMWYDVRTKSTFCFLTNGGLTNANALVNPIFSVFHNQYPKLPNDAGIYSIVNPLGNGCSASHNPSVTLKNYGNNILNSVNINYKIDGGVPAVYNWVGALGIGNQVAVTLPVIIATSGSHKFTCYTSAPNAGIEGYTFNDTAKSDFIVNTSAAVNAPFTENFEGAIFPPPGWNLNSPSAIDESLYYQWGQTSVAPFNGSYSAAIGSAGFFGAFYDLDMPMINITGVTNPALEFEYAYAYYPGYYDSLNVLISSDCGVSWQSLFYKGGYSLKTAPATYNYFWPTAAQWKHETISLAAYTGEVMIRFRKICGWSNNLFIDAVSVAQSTGISTIALNETGISIYPNPTTDYIYMSETGNIALFDFSGKLLLEEKNTNKLDISALPAGMYFLRVGDNLKQTFKVIKE